MRKILKYKLVSNTSLEWFDKMVQSCIDAGYEPLGEHKVTMHNCENGIVITCYSQVMVIYEKDSEQKS